MVVGIIAEVGTGMSIEVADTKVWKKYALDCKTEPGLVGSKVGRIIAACSLLD